MTPKLCWLDDPEVYRVNRLDARSDHYFYEGDEDENAFVTKENVRRGGRLYQSLDGVYKFAYSVNASLRPKDFYRTDFDSSAFDEIKVPGHIELSGYDRIQYINTMYPWEGHYYRRPAYTKDAGDGAGMFSEAEYNPVGSYLKRFDLDEGLRNKRVIIRFEGVEQAFYLWLNGEFVGYAEDSFTPSEFDLTPYIKDKDNLLAVEVHKRSSAAWLEDQDFFRFFGIFRSVTLIAKPGAHIEDMWAKPVLYGDNEGGFGLSLRLSAAETMNCYINIRLSDKEGNEESEILNVTASKEVAADTEYILKEEKISKVIPWDNKNPHLYKLLITLCDENDNIIEKVPYDIGFRRIEIKDKVISLNGSRLIINGVNRHEWNKASGRCIDIQDMLKDIRIMKHNNINAVRTCHYPDNASWYYLCDSFGIYMMAECNLETHGTWQKLGEVEPSYNVPGSIPEWKGAVMDRAESNFHTFKNHTSVLFWSLGNESYAGDNIAAMNKFFKDMDGSRLTHYEGVCRNRDYEDVLRHAQGHRGIPFKCPEKALYPVRIYARHGKFPGRPGLIHCSFGQISNVSGRLHLGLYRSVDRGYGRGYRRKGVEIWRGFR